MATVLPADFPTGTIVANFLFLKEDRTDAELRPDTATVYGKVKFTASVSKLTFVGTTTAVTVPLVFKATIGSDGKLEADTASGVLELPATDSTLLNPVGWTWKAEFDLRDVDTGEKVIVPSFSFQVPAGQTTDLAVVMPVETSPGVITIRGPKGDPGPSGPSAYEEAVANGFVGTEAEWLASLKGPKGDPGDGGVPAGGNALELLRKNSANTGAEWVAPVALPVSSAVQTALDGKVSVGSLFINVKDYGAKGDGTTPDTAAIQAAIDYAAPRKATVFFPPGTYLVAKSSVTGTLKRITGIPPEPIVISDQPINCCIVVRAGVSLLGSGPQASIIKNSTGGVDAILECLDYQDGSIGNLGIIGAGTTNNAHHGIELAATAPRINSNIRLHDLEISNVGSYGIGHQYGQPKNFRYENIYIHDTGADGIDHKVRYGVLDYLGVGTQGVFFNNILVERIGNRVSRDISGIGVRGQANLTNIVVRDIGTAGSAVEGIGLEAGIATGADMRTSATKTVLSNFYVEGNLGADVVGVSIWATGSVVVSNGTIRNCTDPSGGGVWAKPLTATPYGYLQGPVISNVSVEGSRGQYGITAALANTSVIGCKVSSDIESFDSRRSNLVAGQKVFTLKAATLAGFTDVNKNGTVLVSGTDYTLSGTTLTLTTGVASTDRIDVIVKGLAAVYVSALNCSIVGVSTDGYTPGVKISGPTTKKSTLVAGNSGAYNEPTLFAGSDSGAMEVSITGAGTSDIDLRLNAANNGYLRFGAFTTSADAPIAGYVTIKDAAGNLRKLAVIT